MKRNDIKTQSLQMTVYDYDRIGSGEYVGEVRTPIHSYITRYSVRNGNVMVMSICIAPVRETSLRRSGIARIVKGCHSFTCTARPQAEWAIPAFVFPAAAGTHLSTSEGWKAE